MQGWVTSCRGWGIRTKGLKWRERYERDVIICWHLCGYSWKVGEHEWTNVSNIHCNNWFDLYEVDVTFKQLRLINACCKSFCVCSFDYENKTCYVLYLVFHHPEGGDLILIRLYKRGPSREKWTRTVIWVVVKWTTQFCCSLFLISMWTQSSKKWAELLPYIEDYFRELGWQKIVIMNHFLITFQNWRECQIEGQCHNRCHVWDILASLIHGALHFLLAYTFMLVFHMVWER